MRKAFFFFILTLCFGIGGCAGNTMVDINQKKETYKDIYWEDKNTLNDNAGLITDDVLPVFEDDTKDTPNKTKILEE